MRYEKLSPRYGHQAQKDHSEGHAAYHSLRNGFYGYPVIEANCRRKRSCAVGSGRRQLSRNPPTVIFFVIFFFPPPPPPPQCRGGRQRTTDFIIIIITTHNDVPTLQFFFFFSNQSSNKKPDDEGPKSDDNIIMYSLFIFSATGRASFDFHIFKYCTRRQTFCTPVGT